MKESKICRDSIDHPSHILCFTFAFCNSFVTLCVQQIVVVAVNTVTESNINGWHEQQKRVPVTIRYSTESGLKPYYLTVAKRVKDQYPDVIIDRIEVSGEDISGGETAEGETNAGTFEVLVDGKIVVKTNQRAGTHPGSIFVSMSEMDLAISRARKRRRPSTVYGENGVASADEQDTFVKSRLEFLKQRSRELQQNNNNAGSDGPE